MREEAGRGTYLAIVLLAGLLAGCSQSYLVLFACKFFCDSFVVGYSAAKTMLFLTWLLLLMILRLVPLSSNPWMRSWCTILLACSYLMTVAEYFIYCARVGIKPWTEWTAVALDGSYSFNTPGHLHVSKGLMSTLLRYHTGGDTMDAGYPFLPIFPGWWTLLHLLVFSGALLLAFPLAREKSFRLSPGGFACFATSFFCLFKSAIDAGPFSQPFLLALAPVLYFLWGKRPAQLAAPWLLLALLLRFLWEEDIQDYEILHGLAICAVLFTPLLTEHFWVRRRPIGVLCCLTGVGYLIVSPFVEFHMIPWTRWQPRAVARYYYGTRPLVKGEEFTIASPFELDPHPKFALMKTFRGQKLRLYQAKALADTSPLEICEDTGLNLARLPITFNPQKRYCQIRAVLFDDWPQDWPNSEIVTNFRWKADGREITLELELRPGSNFNVLKDSLPPGLMVLLEEPVWSSQASASDSWSDASSSAHFPRGQLGTTASPGE